MLKLRRKPHPRAAHVTQMGLLGGHIVYYGAAALGLEPVHAVAAGLVLVLLLLGLYLNVEVN